MVVAEGRRCTGAASQGCGACRSTASTVHQSRPTGEALTAVNSTPALERGPPSVGCAASLRGPRQSPAGGRARAGRPAGVGLGSSQSQARTVGLQSTSYVSSFRYSMSSRPSQRNVMRARHRPARSETHSRVARRDVPLSDGTGLHSPSNRCIAPNVTRPPRLPRARGTRAPRVCEKNVSVPKWHISLWRLISAAPKRPQIPDDPAAPTVGFLRGTDETSRRTIFYE